MLSSLGKNGLASLFKEVRVFKVMCFPFPPRKGQHMNKFEPHPFRGQSREVVDAYWLAVVSPHLPGEILRAALLCFSQNFYLQLTILALLLTVGAFSLTI